MDNKKKELVLGSFAVDKEVDEATWLRLLSLIKILNKETLSDAEAEDYSRNKAEYEKLLDMLNDNKLNAETISQRFMSLDRMKFNKKEVVNEVKYGDGSYGITDPLLKGGSTSNNVLAFKAALKGTSLKVVSLFHSGFSIRISPATFKDIIVFEELLHSEEVALAKDTATIVNSSRRAYLIDNVITFIRDRIVSHPINLPANADIMDYISILDLDIILAAILSASSGKRVNITCRCVNAYTNDEAGNPLCNSEYTLPFNLDKLLFIEKDYLPSEYIKLLAYKDPNTVNVEELDEYRRKLYERVEGEKVDIENGISGTINKGSFILTNSDGVDIKFTLKVPSIKEYLTTSLEYIEDIKSKVSQSQNPDNTYKENSVILKIVSISKVLDIGNAIESISFTDGSGFEHNLNNTTALREYFSGVMELQDEDYIYNKVLEFLESYCVAKICYPKTYCSSCESNGKIPDGAKDGELNVSNMEPVNVLGFFCRAVAIMSSELIKK